MLKQSRLRLAVVLITPHHYFQHLRAEFPPSPQGCTNAPAWRPIFFLGSSDILVRRASIPITIEHMQRGAVIVEAIRSHRQVHAVYVEQPNAIVADHGHSTG